MTQEVLLTTRQAAELLGYQPQTLRKKRLTGGGIPYLRMGKSPKARVAYRMSDVLAWLDSHTFSSTKEEPVSPSTPPLGKEATGKSCSKGHAGALPKGRESQIIDADNRLSAGGRK
jgi:hypothetical protein